MKKVSYFAIGLLLVGSVAVVGQDAPESEPSVQGAEQQESTADDSGASARPRSYIVPTFRFMQSVDSNPQLASNEPGVESGSMISGALQAQRVWRHAQMNLQYDGGASFYTNSSQANTSFHSAGVQQTFEGRRWAFTVGNNFSYLPDSAFGFSGFSVSPYTGGAGAGTGTGSAPLQSILTPYSNRYEDTVDAAWQYRPGARTSLSFSGSYGLLRFSDTGYLDSDSYGAGASFGRQIGKHSSLGMSYSASLVRYVHMDSPMDTHAVRLQFKHQLNKRFSLELAAGPGYSSYYDGQFARSSWNPSVHAGLSAEWNRSSLGLAYDKAVTAGSGVMLGSKTDSVTFSATRRLTRYWTGAATVGYARNSSLQQSSSLTYDSVSTGVSVSRRLGRRASFFAQYNLQRQDMASGVNNALAHNLLRHVFGVGFTWNLRELPIK